MSDSDVTALTEARTRAENAALHAYRERVQLEVASLAGTLRGLAADAADRIDANGPDLHYQGGAHNAYLAASRLCDRALLLAEEAAGKAVGQADAARDKAVEAYAQAYEGSAD